MKMRSPYDSPSGSSLECDVHVLSAGAETTLGKFDRVSVNNLELQTQVLGSPTTSWLRGPECARPSVSPLVTDLRVSSDDFEVRLLSLRDKGILKAVDMQEIILQRAFFQTRKEELAKHQGEVVVACGGDLFYGETLKEAVEKAKMKHKNKAYYSQPIGIVAFPSVYRK